MASTDRITIFPSQSSLSSVRYRLRCAERGESILQRKVDGLLLRSRSIFADLMKRRIKLDETLREAAFSLAEAKFVGGNLNRLILESVGRKARLKVDRTFELIGGERIIGFQCVEAGVDVYELAGLSSSRRQILKVQRNYREILEDLVKVASSLSGLLMLEAAIKKSRRRVNALRHLIIPSLNRTLSYLASELEEKEREELYRLKKFQTRRQNFLKRNFTGEITQRKEDKEVFVLDIFYEDDDLLF